MNKSERLVLRSVLSALEAVYESDGPGSLIRGINVEPVESFGRMSPHMIDSKWDFPGRQRMRDVARAILDLRELIG